LGVGCDALVALKAAKNKQLIIGGYVNMLLAEKPKAQSGGDQFFEGTTFKLLQGLLMYVLVVDFNKISQLAPGQSEPTLRHLRAIVSKSEEDLKKLIGAICEAREPRQDGWINDPADRLFVVQNLAAFVTMAQQTWSGIAATVATDTNWLSTEAFARMVTRLSPGKFHTVEGNTPLQETARQKLHAEKAALHFDLGELPLGNTDVFVQIKGDQLAANKGVVRVLLGSMFKALMDYREEYGGTPEEIARDEAAKKNKRPVLFCLDEVDLLGYMSSLIEVRERGRKYGISLMLLYQSVGQLEKHWGKEDARGWFDSAAIVSFAAIKSIETAELLSKIVGETSVIVEGSSQSSSWRDGILSKASSQNARLTLSTNIQKRALLMPHEVREMRSDQQVIIVRGKPALTCGRAIFFRRPEMLVGLGKSRVRGGIERAKQTVLGGQPAGQATDARSDRFAGALADYQAGRLKPAAPDDELERVPGDIDEWESTAPAADSPSTSEPEDGSSRLLALPPDRPPAEADEPKAAGGDESAISVSPASPVLGL
jgi:type IV secretion system protein VirD4